MVIGYVLDDNLDVADGVQQAVINIAEEMRSRRHEVHYIVAETKRKDLKNVHSLTGQVSLKFNGNSVRTPKYASTGAILELLKKVNFDILHVQMPYSPLFAGRVIKYALPKTRIFGTFHILPYDRMTSLSTNLLGFMSRSSSKKFHKVFAVSQPANEFMLKTYGLSGQVLPNPVNYNLFNNVKKYNSPKSKSKISIVFVGRFEQRKGAFNLAEALNNLPLSILQSLDVTMCGKGPLLEKVKLYAKLNNLPITFPGFVTEDQKIVYLQNADIAVFPSISGESFGIVLAEAMVAGAGVTLGGNNPGYKSVLQEWPQVLFDPNNIDEFSKKLKLFIEDSDLRSKIGKSQHQKSKIYDIKNVCNQLEVFYG